MLSKEHRFHRTASLRFVFTKGKTVRGPYFALRFAPNNRTDTYRAAVIVSKKVHKSAVVRNRIRRRLFELIRLHSGQFVQHLDLVVTVYSTEVATMPAEQLHKQFKKQLKNAHIIS